MSVTNTTINIEKYEYNSYYVTLKIKKYFML